VLSVIAVSLSSWALLRLLADSPSGRCGVKAGDVVACTGTDGSDRSFGSCTPVGLSSGVMYWSCER
jgi:hypothetical protein